LKRARSYFCFGPHLTCYGQTSGYAYTTINGYLFDASEHVHRQGHTSFLPFDPAQIVNNLRFERNIDQSLQWWWLEYTRVKKIYYQLRPFFR